ncbi:MAG: hypothetical protein IPJ65_01090 [Archangiaceae bacterium]|nr:hypothetical protein [Archangiaceae bacterium]
MTAPPERLLAIALLFLSCATPRLVLSRHDAEHQRRADLYTDGTAQWLGEGGERYDSISEIQLSSKGLVYVAHRGASSFVVTPTLTLGPYEAVTQLLLADDRAVFAAAQERRWLAVRDDGTHSRPYQTVQSLRLSPDGRHFAFVGSDGACARVTVDGTEGPCHERVLTLDVDDDGRAAIVIRENRLERVVFQPGDGGTPQPAAEAIAELHVTRGHIAYAARHGLRWAAVVDGAVSSECGRVRHLRFGDAGRRTGWVCADGDRSAVVIDGLEGERWPQVSAPLLRDDATGWAYVAHDASGAWVISSDSRFGPFAEVNDLALGPHGVTFVARENGACTVVHRERRTELAAVVDGSLALSDDGEHWGLISADPKTRTFWLTVDGARMRAVTGEDVFGGSPLGPWVRRSLVQR